MMNWPTFALAKLDHAERLRQAEQARRALEARRARTTPAGAAWLARLWRRAVSHQPSAISRQRGDAGPGWSVAGRVRTD